MPLWEMNASQLPPIVCVVGFSGSGKTTLLVRLIAALKERGLRVGTIKHDAHSFEIDHAGKDSWRHKHAGASTAIITSRSQIAVVKDVQQDHSPEELLPLFTHTDIVLAEGFKQARLPKIEVYRPELAKTAACKGDPLLMAVVSDAPIDWGVPRFGTTAVEALTDLIVSRCHLKLPAAAAGVKVG
jgi:molybdopterin-guanine dinucleotide biosynthesis protein MobB